MSIAPEVEQAKTLIREREFEQARDLLEPLAETDSYAAELLLQLEDYLGEPPPRWQLWKFDRTVLRALIGVLIVTNVILWASVFFDFRQEQAEEANAGRGSMDEPIPLGTAVHFDNFDITIHEIRFPANDDVRGMVFPYSGPAPGNAYLLLRASMLCKLEPPAQCGGRQVKIRLVDNTGEEWEEPIWPLLSGGLDQQLAGKGAVLEGWVMFQFPSEGHTVEVIKMWTTAGPTLYVSP